ncbi:MAG: hypothetical protein NC452_04140 [Eubacterium sp.]|nr:hypothetical protein [Eubacterium sp.]
MGFFADVIATDEALKKVEAAIKELKSHEVLVGVPQEKSSRQGGKGKATNAELLFIHTNGSPIRGIPARPVLQPAIEDDKEHIGEMLGKAIDAATGGKKEEIVPALERAGMYASGKCKAWFTNPSNNWAPNSEETIAKKKSSRPLIDTGEMRKSITYVVK